MRDKLATRTQKLAQPVTVRCLMSDKLAEFERGWRIKGRGRDIRVYFHVSPEWPQGAQRFQRAFLLRRVWSPDVSCAARGPPIPCRRRQR